LYTAQNPKWYSPWVFSTLRIILFTGHGIKGNTLSYIFLDSSFVYVRVCKYIFAYLNLKNKIAFLFLKFGPEIQTL
jgi:hypothetical protein